MRKTRNSHGFTMAEMLIVVAIILILAGVAFIAVQNHQHSMAQLERNTIAKELFIAAQNHLTMAESEGYPVDAAGTNFFGQDASDATVSNGSTDETATPSGDAEADAGKKPTNVYYVIGPSSGNILDLMLPFGSIDETVRAGGSYLIRYQTNPALVLDVFYVTTSGNPARFNKDGGIKDDDYSDLMEMRDSLPSSGYVLGYYGGEEALSSGDIILPPTVEIHNKERLTVTVKDYNNGNTNAALKLIVTGETSGAKLAIKLTPVAIPENNSRFSSIAGKDSIEYTVVLDDITTASTASPYDSSINDGLHFWDLNAYAAPNAFVGSTEKLFEFFQTESGTTPTFKLGEDITVQAVAYSNTALTNIAYSSSRITNSLFADSQPADVASTIETSSNIKAMIGNFRHLENLDVAISGLNPTLTGPKETLVYTEAEQIVDLIKPEEAEEGEDEEDDLSWSGFCKAINTGKGNAEADAVKIYALSDATGTVDDCYRPVDLTYQLAYNGNNHKIEGVVVNYSADAGLFGTVSEAGSSIKNVALIDFDISTSTDNAGALAGMLTSTTVSNVLAYNTADFETELAKTDATKTTVSTTSGSAGGLIGSIAGGTSVSKSAAALIVNATGGNAGGLIGTSTSTGTVSGCYAGGHTQPDTTTNAVIYDSTNFNVTATKAEGATTGGVAGGLIGTAGTTQIDYSYSTCSAKGATAGGLIGTGSGDINYSYCTGRVSGTKQGAFAGECGTTKGCCFYQIINEYEDESIGYDYLPPISKVGEGDGTKEGVIAFDVNAEEYNEFCGASADWKGATPYCGTLEAYYEGKYNLRTVAQLTSLNTSYDPEKEIKVEEGSVDDPADFVATHYGDWPAPEIFVVNTK